MVSLSLHLPGRWRLDLHLVKRRGRQLELLPSPTLLKKFRVGNKLSRYTRYVIEHVNVRKAVGVNIGIVLISSSIFANNVAADDILIDNPRIENPVIFRTISNEIRFPVSEVKITQRYSIFHPGIDLDGETGEPVFPITYGVVSSVERKRTGYGYSITIDHGGEIESLYAHLSKILVSSGQAVSPTDIIGEIGATGRAFGDHLHLEIYQEGKRINPLILLK